MMGVFKGGTSDLWEAVNSPDHYNQTGAETITTIQNSMSALEFQGYLKGNVLKYVSRHMHKGMPLKDILKAQWYLNYLVSLLSEREKGERDD
tara:strand:+ start:4032 stop:4307 length:276 start_codon:yes stop_codon:yes gene_type:complete